VDWHATKMTDRHLWCEDVYSCRFERPKDYSFGAGQYLMLRLPTSDGTLAKPFSHASAPGDSWIEVTTHFSGSKYKSALADLEPGSEVSVSPALGRLQIPADDPVTFLVGGIGITPVRSMLRDAAQRHTGLTGTLFYGNRSPQCVVYRDELDSYESDGIRTVHVFERESNEPAAEEGFITAELVKHHVDPTHGPFVTTGPPAMITVMERVMDELDIEPERRVIERFGAG